MTIPAIELHNLYISQLNAAEGVDQLTGDDLWHHNRRLGVGGSDVGAILGINPYKTALDVYNEKRGYMPPEDLGDNQRVHFGNILEDTVATEYARRTGHKVQKRNNAIVNPSAPWLRANIDRHVVGADFGLECKTVDKYVARQSWGAGNIYQHNTDGTIDLAIECDETAETYLAQCFHYMLATNKRRWDLAALVGGNDFRIFTIRMDDTTAEIIKTRIERFWFDNVISDIPPDPVNNADLGTLYSKDNGMSVIASREIIEKFNRLSSIKAKITQLEIEAYGAKAGGARVGGLDFDIKKFMGDNAELLTDSEGAKLCTWKTQTAKRIDTTALKKALPKVAKEYSKESSSRVFRA